MFKRPGGVHNQFTWNFRKHEHPMRQVLMCSDPSSHDMILTFNQTETSLISQGTRAMTLQERAFCNRFHMKDTSTTRNETVEDTHTSHSQPIIHQAASSVLKCVSFHVKNGEFCNNQVVDDACLAVMSFVEDRCKQVQRRRKRTGVKYSR